MTDTSRLKVRRYGAAVTHWADVPYRLIQPATIMGRDCRTVTTAN